MKKYLLLNILICLVFLPKLQAQDDSEFSNKMEGKLPSNYISAEAAFTPGFSFSAGIDAYIDVFRLFKKQSAPSWVVTGQYYFYTMPERSEEWNFGYGHNFGLRGGGYKIGTGLILFERTSNMSFKFFFDPKTMNDGNTKTSSKYDGPISKSIGVFINYYTENSGTSWKWVPDSINGGGNYQAVSGYNNYIMPSIKFQRAWNFLKKGINPDGQKGWRAFDIGVPFSTDFKQFGLHLEWFMMSGFFTSRFGIGAIYRTDIPNEPDNERKSFLHWYFPITFTLGIGGNWFTQSVGDQRFHDKIINSSKL